MLAADKLQLQSSLKQQATALKEKEFNLHHSNLMTVGTQAAVLAGLDITMFVEFSPASNVDWGEDVAMVPRALKFTYYIMIVSAFCANMIVVSHTTALSVLGAGLALRGPDGSMVTATDGLYEERRSVFTTFGIGLACTVGSVVVCVWLILHWEAALICMAIAVFTIVRIYQNYIRIFRRFGFDENETVSFDDIFNGPAAIQVVKSGLRTIQNTLTMSPRNSRRMESKNKIDIESGHLGSNAPSIPEMNGTTKRRGTSKNNSFFR
mmetsp:Transcript_37794/g.43172  ORF Transcript_37794/g.43172 Transcript_37794/m.43172 type:complete len:265 (+) Transcript_37794:176-970(+)